MNREKIVAALKRGKSTGSGVPPPSTFQLAVEKLLGNRSQMLWDRAAKEALAALPASTSDWADVALTDITKIVAKTVSRYQRLDKLNADLKKRYAAGEKFQRAGFLRSINAAIGVDASALLSNATAERVIQRRLKDSVNLIKSLDEDTIKRLSSTIWEGFSSGKDKAFLKELIAKTGQVSVRHARFIARDQTAKMFSNLAQARQEEVGITKFRWRTAGDSNVRDEHEKLDGNVYTWKDGANGIYPGEEFQCRCVAEPIFDSVELPAESGTRRTTEPPTTAKTVKQAKAALKPKAATKVEPVKMSKAQLEQLKRETEILKGATEQLKRVAELRKSVSKELKKISKAMEPEVVKATRAEVARLKREIKELLRKSRT